MASELEDALAFDFEEELPSDISNLSLDVALDFEFDEEVNSELRVDEFKNANPEQRKAAADVSKEKEGIPTTIDVTPSATDEEIDKAKNFGKRIEITAAEAIELDESEKKGETVVKENKKIVGPASEEEAKKLELIKRKQEANWQKLGEEWSRRNSAELNVFTVDTDKRQSIFDFAVDMADKIEPGVKENVPGWHQLLGRITNLMAPEMATLSSKFRVRQKFLLPGEVAPPDPPIGGITGEFFDAGKLGRFDSKVQTGDERTGEIITQIRDNMVFNYRKFKAQGKLENADMTFEEFMKRNLWKMASIIQDKEKVEEGDLSITGFPIPTREKYEQVHPDPQNRIDYDTYVNLLNLPLDELTPDESVLIALDRGKTLDKINSMFNMAQSREELQNKMNEMWDTAELPKFTPEEFQIMKNDKTAWEEFKEFGKFALMQPDEILIGIGQMIIEGPHLVVAGNLAAVRVVTGLKRLKDMAKLNKLRYVKRMKEIQKLEKAGLATPGAGEKFVGLQKAATSRGIKEQTTLAALQKKGLVKKGFRRTLVEEFLIEEPKWNTIGLLHEKGRGGTYGIKELHRDFMLSIGTAGVSTLVRTKASANRLTESQFGETKTILKQVAGLENHAQIATLLPMFYKLQKLRALEGLQVDVRPDDRNIITPTRQQLDDGGNQNLPHIDENGNPKQYYVAGQQEGAKIKLFEMAGPESLIEETAHFLQDHVKKMAKEGGSESPYTYLDNMITAWENGVRLQALKQGIDIPQGKETFAQAFTAHMGYADKYGPSVNMLEIPDQIFTSFKTLFGTDPVLKGSVFPERSNVGLTTSVRDQTTGRLTEGNPQKTGEQLLLAAPRDFTSELAEAVRQSKIATLPREKRKWSRRRKQIESEQRSFEEPEVAAVTNVLDELSNEILDFNDRTIMGRWINQLDEEINSPIERPAREMQALITKRDQLIKKAKTLPRNPVFQLKDIEGPDAPTFYNNMEKTLLPVLKQKSRPDDLERTLRNKGVSKEEADWIGLTDLINDRKAEGPKATITPEEVRQLVRENGVDIKLESRGRISRNLELQFIADEGGDVWRPKFHVKRLVDEDIPNLDKYTERLEGMEIIKDADGDYMTIDNGRTIFASSTLSEAQGNLESIFIENVLDQNDKVKWKQATEPGGINHEEHVLTMPGQIEPYVPDNIHFTEEGGGTAISWGRTSDRLTQAGEKVRFIEEIQSKRFEDGQEKGYRSKPRDVSNNIEIIKNLDEDIAKLEPVGGVKRSPEEIDQMGFLSVKRDFLSKGFKESDFPIHEWESSPVPMPGDIADGTVHRLKNDPDGTWEIGVSADGEFQIFKNGEPLNIVKTLDRAKNNVLRFVIREFDEGTVPDAPFKDRWAGLQMKQELRLAVEDGQEIMAWTTGRQQSDRYTSAVNLEEIRYERLDDKTPNGETLYSANAYAKDGELLWTANRSTKEALAGHLGKDVANEIATNGAIGQKGSISGADITIGSLGMRNFYDLGGQSSQNIANFMNRFVKKYDGKVEEFDVVMGVFDAEIRKQQGIRITPEMARDVKKGLPAFQLKDVEGNPTVKNKKTGNRVSFKWLKLKGKGDKTRIIGALRDIRELDTFRKRKNAVRNLMTLMNKYADEGVNNKEWYEPVSTMLYDITGRNAEETRRLAQLISLHSPRNSLAQNSSDAITAYYKWKDQKSRGVSPDEMDFRVGKTPNKTHESTMAVFVRNEEPSGQKVNPFFRNLMINVDKTIEQTATINSWMARAIGFKRDKLTGNQVAFSQGLIEEIARQRDWKPWQVQSAIWATVKDRWDRAKAEVMDVGIQEGWAVRQRGKLFEEEVLGVKEKVLKSGRIKERIVVLDKDEFHKRMVEMHPDVSEAINPEKFTFVDGFRQMEGRQSYEAISGRESNHMSWLHDMPFETKMEYSMNMWKAMEDEFARNIINREITLTSLEDFVVSGIWEDQINPSAQRAVILPRVARKSKDIHPDFKNTQMSKELVDKMDVAAAMFGYYLHQDAVGYHKFYQVKSPKKANAMLLNTGKFASPKELIEFKDAFKKQTQGFDPAIVPSENGIRILNLPNFSGPLKGQMMDNLVMHDIIRDIGGDVFGEETSLELFGHESNLIENNWKEAPNGEDYLKQITNLGASDILRRVDGLIQQPIARAERAFSEKYGRAVPDELTPIGTKPTTSASESLGAIPATAYQLKDVAETPPPGHSGPGGQIFNITPVKAWEALRINTQDRMLRLQKIQNELVEQGAKLVEESDAYLHEEVYWGKVKTKVEDVQKTLADPIAKIIKSNDFTLEEVDNFLTARHAPERNNAIAAINDALPDGGSGMTSVQAQSVIRQARRDGKLEQYEQIAALVDGINNSRLDVMVAGGLIDENTKAIYQEKYPKYVPLRGFEDIESSIGEDAQSVPLVGRGFGDFSKEKRALGRKSRAFSPLITSISMLQESIIRAEKNTVGMAFHKFITDNPDPNMWEIDKIETRATLNPNTGKVEYRHGRKLRLASNDFPVKINGEQHVITINDSHLANAMKQMGTNKSNLFLRTMGTTNRYLASINTSLSLPFVVSNFIRDLQTAGFNITAEQGPKMLANVLKDIPGAASGALRGELGNSTKGSWSRWYQRYREAGGQIGFFGLENIDTIKDNFLQSVGTTKWGTVKKGLKSIVKPITIANTTVENAVRLSLFKNLVESGVSEMKAASASKNVTVNFNRKGTNEYLGAAFLFYNASVQGIAKLLLTADPRTKAGKTLLTMGASVGLAGYTSAVYNRSVAGNDDSGQNNWDGVAPWEKERNMIWMDSNGSGKFSKVPMAYGYNIFWVLGTQIENMMNGGDALTASKDLTLAILSAFNPLGSQQSKTAVGAFLKTITPTVLKPGVQHVMNENFAGIPIRREAYPGQKTPDSELYFRGVRPISKKLFKNLNEATGGTINRAGAIDVNPETADFIWDWGTGGMGRYIAQTVNLIAAGVTGEKTDIKQIPILNKFRGQVYERMNIGTFYELSQELDTYHKDRREIARSGTPLEKKMVQVRERFKDTRSEMRRLNDKIGRAIELGLNDKVKTLEEKKLEAANRALKFYRENITDKLEEFEGKGRKRKSRDLQSIEQEGKIPTDVTDLLTTDPTLPEGEAISVEDALTF